MAKYYNPTLGITQEINPELNPDLIKGLTKAPETTPLGVISPDISKTIKPIDVPSAPTLTNPDMIGTQATLDATNKLLTPTDTGASDLLSKYLSATPPPSSIETTYKSAYETAGLAGKEQAVTGATTEAQTAQNELASINAQLAGITAEQQAIPIRLQKEAEGRGITVGGLAPIETAQLRDLALRAIPLQAQAYAAQAKVAAAQGNVALAQSTLQLGQDKLNTLFNLKTEDTTNTYNYWKDLRDKAFDYASTAEKNKLAAQQKADDRSFTQWQNTVNDAQSKASILMSTQPDLATKITARIGQSSGINDTSLAGDVANLLAQAQPTKISELQKEKPATQAQQTVAGYAARLEQAEPTLKNLENNITEMNIVSFEAQRKLPAAFQTANMQQYMQAARNFINAILRRESGAVISPSEFSEARQQYLPAPGDTKETLNQKELNRRLVFENLKRASGTAFTSVDELLSGISPKVEVEEEAWVDPKDGTEYVKGEDGLYYPK